MIGIVLCSLALIIAFFSARKSLGAGLVSVMSTGYAYGILRANFAVNASHFIFDAAILGFYAGAFITSTSRADVKRSRLLEPWVALLIGWPLLLFFVPIQDWAIQLVGLRGAIYFLPFLILGARMHDEDFADLATGIAILNLAAFAFAVYEFQFGLRTLYPVNEVTELIYRSNDAGLNRDFRIPATFVNAGAYGGVMALTFPFLAGMWAEKSRWLVRRRLFELAMFATAGGVFMSASRTSAVMLFASLIIVFTGLKMKATHRVALAAMFAIVLWAISKDDRLQRFQSLGDSNVIATRIGWSVNSTFTDLLFQYPMGNGLGGGGSSIPYFLENRLHGRVLAENEYGRIMLEQGVLGLIAWVVFVVWLIAASFPRGKHHWYMARRMLWSVISLTFLGAPIGTGLLTSIPSTAIMLLGCGWLVGQNQTAKLRAPNREAPPEPQASIMVQEPILAGNP